MNVLVFTTAILMVLAMITYARIEMYTNFTAVQQQFETYMAHGVETYVNKEAKKQYDETVLSPKASKGDKDKPPPKPEGSAKLEISVFIDKNKREPTQLEEASALFSNLLMTLYKGHSFFDEMLQERPDFIQELLGRIMLESDALPEGQKITEPKGLANLNFKDEKLQLVFYKMMHGNERLDEAAKEQVEPQEGEYFPLINYLTIDPKTKVRVYLAPYTILVAIFGSKDYAHQVIALREAIYKNLVEEKMTEAEGMEELKGQFLNLRQTNISETLLDFTVSKTNPKDYRTPN